MTTAPILSGQDINLAAFATRTLLEEVLREADISFEGWVALRRLAAERDTTKRDDFAAMIAALPGVPLPPVADLIEELSGKGLVRVESDDITVTTTGRARFEQVTEGGNRIAAELYAPFADDELETTRRVLHAVTDRATAMHSSA
jgi:DNA-binding MarR family transcriptional regulator